jgi:NADPH:quinone reductase-like Zn-dependent oxidoreductase
VKAVQFATYGPADVLQVADVAEPHAGPGQVRIAVRAAGVNPVDWKIRGGTSGGFHDLVLPHIPGMDAAGVIDEVGDGVDGAAIGDEVFGQTDTGASAEFALLSHFGHKPSSLSWAEAAGLPSAAETALRAIDDLGVATGNTIVVSGAAGGVGLAAVQLLRERGAIVVGTASEGNVDYLRSLGVLATTYGPGLPERVHALLSSGVDYGLDVAGHGAYVELVQLTGSPDRVVTLADFAATEHGVRFNMGLDGRSFEAFELVAGLIEAGRFVLPVAQTFSFAEAAAAHRASETGHVRGKLVLLAP